MTILRQAGPARGTRTTGRVRMLLVVFEVALSLVLVVGAGLMVRTIARLVAVSPGYDAGTVMSAQISQPGDRYEDEERIRQFGDRVIADVRALPGVANAALAFAPGPFWTPRLVVPSRPAAPGQEPAPFTSAVTPGFFDTMGIPLKRGRLLDSRDRPGAPVAVVVSETFVREVLGGGEPLGQRLGAVGIPQMAAMEIVGVVGDTRRLGLGVPPDPEMYVSYAQMTVSDPTLLVRASAGDPLTLARAVDRRIAAVDSTIPRIRPRRLADELSGSIRNRRAIMALLGVFAAVALLLTALGIGGVVSYSVAERTPEIGVRIALGADPGTVQWLIVGNALLPVLAGIVLGGVAAIPFTTLIRSFLYNLTPFDPVSVFAGIGVLLLAAAAAAWIPARRATRIDPLAALRTR